MTEMVENPFAEIEEMLASPAATGLFLTAFRPTCPLLEAGAEPGDIVTAVGETAVSELGGYLQAMQPQGEGDETRVLHVRKRDGSTMTCEVPTPLSGYGYCVVKAGESAWDQVADTPYEPDFSGLADGTEIWLRNSLGDERAGFERLILKRDGDLLEIDTLFRLGGDDPQAGAWDYRTRALSSHRLDRWLSVVRTAFWEGSPGEERLSGDVSLGDDGFWRGTHGQPDGTESPAEFAAVSSHVMTPYTLMVLPLTMPLEEGACVNVVMVGDGSGVASSRRRIECTGKKTVTVDGAETEAWCFAWRHYGVVEGTELFYVSDDRRLVRVEWGPGYGYCNADLVDRERVLDGVPEHVTVE
jgi:hypothetical protein